MNDIYPNPWDFSNDDENLTSPDGKFKVDYKDFGEIAMGGPIGGTYSITVNGRIVKLADSGGGPIVWSALGDKIAIPVWTKSRRQKIAVFDINAETLTLFKKEFKVLHLSGFRENIIHGTDSPIYKPVTVYFEIEKESIEKITYL